VRSAEDAFDDLPDIELKDEMLELAGHIIGTKMGKFDPGKFDDRYEAALAELVTAKIEGREIRKRPEPRETEPSDLLEALRLSAGGSKPERKGKSKSAAKPARMKKAS
jgi:DNA end-binding protein Ku